MDPSGSVATTSMSVSLGQEDEPGEWEFRQDADGFTYKILKRQRLLNDHPALQASSIAEDPKAEERGRKLRKKKTLLKLKSQYEKEILHWELLSKILHSMQDKANQQPEMAQTSSSSMELAEVDVKGNENASGSLIDELLSQAEAQEAMIKDVSYLCDVAEAMCHAQQEWLAQSYIDLPIWSSPRELMASLCDTED